MVFKLSKGEIAELFDDSELTPIEDCPISPITLTLTRRRKEPSVNTIKSLDDDLTQEVLLLRSLLPPKPANKAISVPKLLFESQDNCSACLGIGNLLCCDSCPKVFHLSCLSEGYCLDPTGSWQCRECRPKPASQLGIFDQLIYQMDCMNPISFLLPASIRNDYEHITTNSVTGAYIDTRDVEIIGSKAKPKTESSVCFKCSLATSTLINCDYCGLGWHLDCLDPPLASIPHELLYKDNGIERMRGKWMCPLHSDWCTPKIPRTRVGDYPKDVQKYIKNGWIRIINDEPPKDTEMTATEGHRLKVEFKDWNHPTVDSALISLTQGLYNKFKEYGQSYRSGVKGLVQRTKLDKNFHEMRREIESAVYEKREKEVSSP